MRLAHFGYAVTWKVVVALVVLACAAEPVSATQFWIGKSFHFGEKSNNAPEGKSGTGMLNKVLGATVVSYGLVRLSEKLMDNELPQGERWMYTGLMAGSILSGQNLMPQPREIGSSQMIVTSRTIESRIDGEFFGWSGDTVFVLQNGQVWQQARYGYKYSYKYNPRVWIVKDGLRWTMKVGGLSDSVVVKRIR